jgi:hypothetical protein
MAAADGWDSAFGLQLPGDRDGGVALSLLDRLIKRLPAESLPPIGRKKTSNEN